MEYLHLPVVVVAGRLDEELESKLSLSEAKKKTRQFLLALKRFKLVFRRTYHYEKTQNYFLVNLLTHLYTNNHEN